MKLAPLALLALGQGCQFVNAFQAHRISSSQLSHPSRQRSVQLLAAEVADPPPATATTNKSQNKYDNLIQWFLSSSDESYISPKIAIRPSTRGGLATGGYGAFANDDFEDGELLLRIPRVCCVTLDDALNDTECGPSFKNLMEKAGPGSDTVVLAGYMAKEYLLMKEYDRRLKAGEKDDDNSEMRRLSKIKFAPYFRTLPWERGVNAQEHVLFWENSDVDALLKGSLAYDDAIETRSTVSSDLKMVW